MRNHFARNRGVQSHFVKKRLRNSRLTRHHSCPRPPLPTQTSTRRPSQMRPRVRRLPRTKLKAQPPSQAQPWTRSPSRARPSTRLPSRTQPQVWSFSRIHPPAQQLSWAQRHSQARPSARQPSRTQLPIPAFRSSCRTSHRGEASRRISCNTCLTLHLDSFLFARYCKP